MTIVRLAWGDYDEDGDLDILLAGYAAAAPVSKIYRNDDCADLAVTKQVSATTLHPGDDVTYTLAFTNVGETSATGVTITDNWPAEIVLTGVTSSTDGSFTLTQTSGTPPTLAWTSSAIPPGASGIITLIGTVDDALQGIVSITNTVTVASAVEEPSLDNNTDSVEITVIELVTLDVATTGNGSVTKQPDQAQYLYGTVVTLNATAGPYSHFARWSGDAGGSANPLAVTLNGSKNITAVFELDTYPLNITIVGGGAVTKQPNLAQYPHGTVVTLTAIADTGWTFSGWTGDAGGSANPLTVTMDRAKNITATFTLNTYPLNVTVVGNGSVSKQPNLARYPHGTVVTLTATASPLWRFARWSGDAGGSANPLTVTMDRAKNITATFEPITYALNITTVGNGSVSKQPDQAQYPQGEVVTLTATPDTGSTFTGWSGDAGGSANPLTVTMDRAKNITATFTQNQYTLEVTVVGGGSVSKQPNQAQYPHGDDVTLTATASRRLDLHRLERRRRRQRQSAGRHHGRAQEHHRHLHPEPVHPGRDRGGQRRRDQTAGPGAIPARRRGHAHSRCRYRLGLHPLERRRGRQRQPAGRHHGRR